MHGSRNLLLVSAAAIVGLVLLLRATHSPRSGKPSRDALVVYCAAGLKPPVERVAREYERSYGIPIHLQYGGSGTLLSNLRVSAKGDLFLAADESYLALARTNRLLAEVIPLAEMVPVIAVRKGNPKHIQTVADLLRAQVALANPDAAAIGRITRELLQRSGRVVCARETRPGSQANRQ